MKNAIETLKETFENAQIFKKLNPEMAKNYKLTHDQVFKDGVLDQKTKELIAVAVAVVFQCDPCISAHTHNLAKLDVESDAVAEACAVAISVAAGSKFAYSSLAIKALEEFKS